jgi:hypothetical protein
VFILLLLICCILNITPEKDANAPPLPLALFPPQLLPQLLPLPITLAASNGNGGGRQRQQK